MANTKKRAPGGGRKPRGPFRGNTAVLGLRMQPDLREDLERQAKRNRTSLSQEIQRRLKASLAGFGRKRPTGIYGETQEAVERNTAFGELLTQLAAKIESATGASWRHDRYTFDALLSAVRMLLDRMAPAESAGIPLQIQEEIERLGSLGDQLKQPEGTAAMVALGLLYQMTHIQRPPGDHAADTHYSDQYYVLPQIRQALNLNGDEK